MSYHDKIKYAEKKSFRFLLAVIFIAIIVGIILMVLTPPALNDDFCPKDKERIYSHHLSIFIDLTSKLSNQNIKIVQNIFNDWIDSNIPMQKLSIYFLNTTNINNFEDTLTICSPPKSLYLSLAFGRNKAEEKIKKFKLQILEIVMNNSIENKDLKNSKIIESINQITNSTNWFNGSSRLVIISDLIEYSEFGNFLNKDIPNFDDWKNIKQNESIFNSIQISRGDRIQICQILTSEPGYKQREKAKEFWLNLFKSKGVDEVFLSCNGLVKD